MNLYQSIFILLVVNSLAFSAVHYTTFDEPIILTGSQDQDLADFFIDFDNNGDPELMFEQVSRFDPNHVDLYSDPGSDTEILVEDGNKVLSLNESTLVSMFSRGWKNNSAGFFSQANKLDRHFTDDIRGYIAIRFPVNERVHYGWVEVSVPSDRSQIRIYSYGYNTVPGMPVLTGQTLEFSELPIE